MLATMTRVAQHPGVHRVLHAFPIAQGASLSRRRRRKGGNVDAAVNEHALDCDAAASRSMPCSVEGVVRLLPEASRASRQTST